LYLKGLSERGKSISIIDFYNSCEEHLGQGMCSHYVCNAIYQVAKSSTKSSNRIEITIFLFSLKVYTYIAVNKIQYGVLSTFERSWICKIENDANSEALPEMQITEPYATSYLGQRIYKDLERHSLYEVLFVLFSLMHESNNCFKINNCRCISDDKDKENNETTLTSNSVISLPNYTTLQMPDFSHVNSLKILPWEQGFLAQSRCGKVFIGAVNGIKAAVKVISFSIFK
jgi:hypothetical protein